MHDPAQTLGAALADRYIIEREIGAGGMATVYLARDLRHDRHVALKLLKPDLGAVLGAERFLAEIKVTANLQHPNLLPLFDSGAVGGLLYYVMPFVEGESLRVRLDREKQLPVDEAIRIAVAIANALDYAHSHGVIHRDLKPENILLQHGQPVVADFGIALAVSNAGGNRITQTGLSLGTPQYMSPEQATGDRAIDGRSDLYSLAAMTYEMLTGEAPHTGTTAQAIIARLLTDKPRSMRAMRAAIPDHVEAAILHALEKLPADRFTTAREFAEALQGRGVFATAQVTQATSVLASAARPAAAPPLRTRLRDPLVLGLGALAVLGASAAVVFATRGGAPPDDRVVRYVLHTPDSARLRGNYPWPGAASPDGRTIIYSGAAPGAASTSFYAIRSDQLEPRVVPGTLGAWQPLFSPDGQWLLFQHQAKTKKVRLDGSAPVTVTDANAANGADWTTRDEIVFGAEGSFRGLTKVSAAGGPLVQITYPDTAKGESQHVWPIALPDGGSVVFTVWSGALASSTLAVASLDDGAVTPLGLKGVRPLAVLDDILVYVQADGAVMAVALARGGKAVVGSPVPVHDPVAVITALNGNSEIFISSGGALITSRGGVESRLSWLAADGRAQRVSADSRPYTLPRLSPNGQRAVLGAQDGQRSEVWVHDFATSTLSRLSANGSASSAAWSADGRNVYYLGAGQDARFSLFVQPADGGQAARPIASTSSLSLGLSVDRAEKWAAFSAFVGTSWDIYRVRLDSAGATPEPYVNSSHHEVAPQFSPDGRWLALGSDETGLGEVYIRSFPNPSARVQISSGGANEPVWSADGSRLFYRAGNNIVAARLATSGTPQVLSRDTVVRDADNLVANGLSANYDVARDGRVLGLISDRNDYQLVIVPNWRAELKARMSQTTRR